MKHSNQLLIFDNNTLLKLPLQSSKYEPGKVCQKVIPNQNNNQLKPFCSLYWFVNFIIINIQIEINQWTQINQHVNI